MPPDWTTVVHFLRAQVEAGEALQDLEGVVAALGRAYQARELEDPTEHPRVRAELEQPHPGRKSLQAAVPTSRKATSAQREAEACQERKRGGNPLAFEQAAAILRKHFAEPLDG